MVTLPAELRYGTPPSAVMNVFYGLLPQGKVLTVGCGSENGSSCVTGQQVIYSDLSLSAAAAQPFVAASASQLPFSSCSFDAILAKDVLEHIPDVLGALTELRRVAKPGATLVAIVPRAIARAVWDDPTHVRGFTQRAIERGMATTGWQPNRTQRMGGVPGLTRLGLERHLLTLMRVPGLAHYFGTNWLVQATADRR